MKQFAGYILKELWQHLYELDKKEAQRASKEPCAHCGGTLHQCNYDRKPRGVDQSVCEGMTIRFSFCCGTCRRRVTPASTRFLGRKVYSMTFILLESALRQGSISIDIIRKIFNVPESTARRWRLWWTNQVSASRYWREVKGWFLPPVDEDNIPLSLFERFEQRILDVQKFISPLSIPNRYPF